MSSLRRAKLLKNMALKEKARMPQYIQRQSKLREEIGQIEALLDRMAQLLRDAGDADVQQAHRLQSNRWYELRLIEESQTLRNKADFLSTELENISAAISRMSHKQQLVSKKAQESLEQVHRAREARLDGAFPPHQKQRRT